MVCWVKQHCTLRKDINIPLVTFFQVSEVLPPSSLCSHLISKSYSSGLSILLQMSMSGLLSAEKKCTGTLFTCTHISFLFLLGSFEGNAIHLVGITEVWTLPIVEIVNLQDLQKQIPSYIYSL